MTIPKQNWGSSSIILGSTLLLARPGAAVAKKSAFDNWLHPVGLTEGPPFPKEACLGILLLSISVPSSGIPVLNDK